MPFIPHIALTTPFWLPATHQDVLTACAATWTTADWHVVAAHAIGPALVAALEETAIRPGAVSLDGVRFPFSEETALAGAASAFPSNGDWGILQREVQSGVVELVQTRVQVFVAGAVLGERMLWRGRGALIHSIAFSVISRFGAVMDGSEITAFVGEAALELGHTLEEYGVDDESPLTLCVDCV